MKIAVKENQLNKTLRVTNIDTILKMMESECFDERINAIRTAPDNDTRKALKESLPQMFMFEPYDVNAGSTASNVKAHNTLLVFDVDIYDRFDELKEQVFGKIGPRIVFAFKSPSGGLKFAVRTSEPINDKDDYKHVYKKLLNQFKTIGINCEMDDKTCNLNRATYVSDSSFIYKNYDAKSIGVSNAIAEYRAKAAEEKKNLEFESKHRANEQRDEASAIRYRAAALKKIMDRMGNGNRHTNIYAIGTVILETGGSIYDVQTELELLRVNRQYTESMSPASKAQDIYQSWVNNGSKLHDSCFARTCESTAARIRARLAN